MPSWVQQFQALFTGSSNTSPGTVGPGWVDSTGNAFSVQSGLLHDATPQAGGVIKPLYNTGVSSYVTQQVVVALKGQTWNGTSLAFGLRANLTGTPNTWLEFQIVFQATDTFWALTHANTSADIYFNTVQAFPPDGHDITLTMSVSGSLPTVATLTVTDNTAGNAVLFTGSYTWSTPDSLQEQSGTFVIPAGNWCSNTYSITYYNGVSGNGQVYPTSSTTNTISLAFNSASAGTGPYTRSLYYNTVSNFTAPGAGTLVSTLTGQSGTTSSWTFTAPAGAAPGSTYYFQVVETDANSNTLVSYSAGASTAFAPVLLGLIGDSITVEQNQSFWTNAQAAYLYRTVTVDNQGIGGTTSGDWIPTNPLGYYTAAAASFTSAGNTWTSITLGMNDALTARGPIAASAYKANVAAICAAEVAAGRKVLLNQPTYGSPGATDFANNATPDLLVQYSAAIDQLVDNVNIFRGDRQSYLQVANNASAWLDFGIHPSPAGTQQVVNNIMASLMAVMGVTSQVPSAGGGVGMVPAASDVRHGVAVGSGTGTCYVPTASQVLSGVPVDATSGTVVLPTAAAVESGVTFGPGSGTTGTYQGIDPATVAAAVWTYGNRTTNA
jgi:lysophospholipase L1-like esterase